MILCIMVQFKTAHSRSTYKVHFVNKCNGSGKQIYDFLKNIRVNWVTLLKKNIIFLD